LLRPAGGPAHAADPPRPARDNLEKLALLESLAERVARGELPAHEGARRVDEIVDAAPRYGGLLRTLCFSLASGTAARFFGGGLREVALSALMGLATGILALTVPRLPEPLRRWPPGSSRCRPRSRSFRG